jgi:hypothetical protein
MAIRIFTKTSQNCLDKADLHVQKPLKNEILFRIALDKQTFSLRHVYIH